MISIGAVQRARGVNSFLRQRIDSDRLNIM
jgi:hypothetical protein